MKAFIIFFCCLLSVDYSLGQCNMNDLFIVDLGISRFQALKEFQLRDNYQLEEPHPYSRGNYWDKPEYLEGDSVYRSSLNYVIDDHACFNSGTANMSLRFADDILYSIDYYVDFDLNKFKLCYEAYTALSELLKPLYEGYYETEFKSYTSGVTPEESNGEVIVFYSGPEDLNNTNETRLSYYFEHEYKWDSNHGGLQMTGYYERIVLELGKIDLTLVKLDNRGY